MSQQGMRDRLTYTPGDGNVYRWSGGPWITVWKITNQAGARVEVLQADVIAVPESTTGENLMSTVDEWRATR